MRPPLVARIRDEADVLLLAGDLAALITERLGVVARIEENSVTTAVVTPYPPAAP